MPRSNDRPCATRLCMYLSKAEGVAILNCYCLKTNVLSRGSGKFVLLVKKTTHVFARGGGNFELV